MNRRAFLASLAAGFAIDPDRLLWRPGAKLISVPKPRVDPTLLRAGDRISLKILATFSSLNFRIDMEDESENRFQSSTPLVDLNDQTVFIATRPMRIVGVSYATCTAGARQVSFAVARV